MDKVSQHWDTNLMLLIKKLLGLVVGAVAVVGCQAWVPPRGETVAMTSLPEYQVALTAWTSAGLPDPSSCAAVNRVIVTGQEFHTHDGVDLDTCDGPTDSACGSVAYTWDYKGEYYAVIPDWTYEDQMSDSTIHELFHAWADCTRGDWNGGHDDARIWKTALVNAGLQPMAHMAH